MRFPPKSQRKEPSVLNMIKFVLPGRRTVYIYVVLQNACRQMITSLDILGSERSTETLPRTTQNKNKHKMPTYNISFLKLVTR